MKPKAAQQVRGAYTVLTSCLRGIYTQ